MSDFIPGLALALIAFVLAAPAHAADIKIDVEQRYLVLEGRLVHEDFETFKTKAAQITGGARVFLTSEGGCIEAGIEIGRMIRMRGWQTVVPPNAICASACALAWFGGTPRIMWPTSKIGFHAAYILRDGKPSTHAPGNAVVGAYLSQLGFSYAAIGYITSAEPTSLKWMTPEDAKRYGIAHEVMENKEQKAATPAAPPAEQPEKKRVWSHEEPDTTLEKAMKNQAILVRAEWSKSVPNWDKLRRAYGERVLFHEKEISADEVIAAKKRFAERWPLRTYSIRQDDTLIASCLRPINICQVRGIMDWRVHNPSQNKVESGVDTFEYKIRWTGDHYEVLAETTKLISGEPLPSFFSYKAPAPKQSAPSSFRVAGVDLDDVLNVRNGPSPEHAVIGSILPDADGIRIVGPCVSAWCPIQHRGLSGWVNSFYLKPSL